MKKIPRWTERITKILMTEVRAKTALRAAANGADRAVALEVEAVRALLAQGHEKERSPSPGPGRALLHRVVHEDHEAGTAVQGHEAGEVHVVGEVVEVAAEMVVEIGALMTTMTKRATGSMLLTWTVMLPNGTWRSFLASMGH